MTENLESLVVGVREAAKLLDVEKQSVYKLIREKKLPGVRIGRNLKIPRAAILALINPAAPLQGTA